MHTTEINEAVFIHNGDYSGDVILKSKQDMNPLNDQEITIPIIDLLNFVGEIKRQQFISKIEQMPVEELLNIKL
jgi:hypothetical protein